MVDEKYNCEKFIHIDPDHLEDGRQWSLDDVSSFYNNEEYLNNQTEDLKDSTSPVTRKRFSPVVCDENKSFSVKLNQEDNCYEFDENENLNPSIFISPSDVEWVDFVESTVMVNNSNYFSVPYETIRKNLNTSTRTYFNRKGHAGHINEYWYISYRRGKPYTVKKKWLSQDDRKMDAVCRSQTFVPKADGYLEELSLKLKSPKNPVYPLIIEIAKTTKKHNPCGRNYIKKMAKDPDPSNHCLLARAVLKSKGTSPSLRTVRFNNPPYLKQGDYYSIILRSPFTRAKDPYWVGGWTKWCKQSHQKGMAYTSVDNGYNWKKHGKREKTARHYGKWSPTNFYYICGIRPADKLLPKQGDYFLYTRPISLNPVKKVKINARCSPDIKFFVYNNADNKWTQANKKGEVIFSKGNYPNKIRVKALFSYGGKENVPYLQYLEIQVDMEKPTTAILRTVPFSPRLEGLLSASIYSKINAPYLINGKNKEKEGVSVDVDIVQESPHTEFINIVSINDIFNKEEGYEYIDTVNTLQDSHKGLIKELENNSEENKETRNKAIKDLLEVNINGITLPKRLAEEGIYLIENPNFEIALNYPPAYPLNYVSFQPDFSEGDNETYHEKMKYLDIYKETQEELDMLEAGVMYDSDNKEYKDKLTHIMEECDKKLEECDKKLMTLGDNSPEDEKFEGKDLSEFSDFKVDYVNGIITFSEDILKYFRETGGHLIIGYNPCFITNIKNNEFPFRIDLFKEEVIVPSKTNFSFKLKAPALDPIRKVCTNINTNNEVLLIEDEDFVVDYMEHTIHFNTSKIKSNEMITIKYTPYLIDESISLLYKLKRTDLSDKVKIKPNYIEYKT